MEAEDNIQKMYKYFGILADAKENIAEKEPEYLEILSAVKGSTKEKRLASQFITRFFKYFPNLAAQALEAQLDLCEDEDICIRKQAIKDLPVLCKESKEYLTKIADILAQLLQADDSMELQIAQNSLLSLFKIDAKGALTGIFSQMQSNEEIVRERSMKFILNKVMPLGKDIIKKDVEDLIITECKKVMQNITCDEFETLMTILSSTHLISTPDGQKELVELLANTAELDQFFNPKDVDQVNRFITCLDFAIPFFSAHIESTKFIVYICEFLNRYTLINDNDKQFIILKLLAESVLYCGKLQNPEAVLGQLYQALIDMVTVPENDASKKVEDMDLHRVEALLYTFHKLGKQCPDFLSKDPEKQKEFKKKLLYIGTCTQTFVKIVRQELKGRGEDDVKTDPKIATKLEGLRLACNINTLIKELFNIPPRFKAIVTLSWVAGATKSKLAQIVQEGKKHEPISVDGKTKRVDGSTANNSQQLYQPPKDKFSAKFSNNTNSNNSNRRSGGTNWNNKRSFDSNNSNRRSWRPY
ncbi:apoptosis inhibitor 5 [Daktulosphaira vitifoliae]|uniref:apoptosis inhibitor 5 n=1 Tax=Daktulosphaira vitifoliae TaxID=58002 RepID=UPI0021AADCDD|nr:apoptosis inhibitor 5 [Daktulosphaira vitifoliae]